LSARIHEREIAYVLSLLRAEDIEPVLVKGWAIARLYPDAALRPYGDLDLCVRPDQFKKANAVLACLDDIDGHQVDLHPGFTRVGQTKPQDSSRRLDRFRINAAEMCAWDELFSRSQLIPLNVSLETGAIATDPAKQFRASTNTEPGAVATGSQVTVRVLGDEDHLRILSAHLLRSGARRPPWLCDIALLMETRGKDFNWNVCLGDGSNRNVNWLATTVGLAQQLLHADIGEIENTRLAEQLENSPRWLSPSVLREWGRSRVQSPKSKIQSHIIARGLQTPDSRLGTRVIGLWTKFDNPMRSTAAVGGQFNNLPRLPYRLAELLTRVSEAPRQLLSLVNQLKVTSLSSEVSPEDRAGWDARLRLTE
jgi:hypothetical protein